MARGIRTCWAVRRRRILPAFCLCFAFAAEAAAADKAWWCVATPNFEVFTDAGETLGRKAAERMEQVRSVLAAAPPWGGAQQPVRVYLFRSRADYAKYQPTEITEGFFQSSPEGDSIVLHTAAEDWPRIASHEYVHVVLNHAPAALPRWLEEGLAEFYSTMRPTGGRLAVGGEIARHVQVLRAGPWLRAEDLEAVDHDFAAFRRRKQEAVFYAQSWALVHMMNFAPGYQERMPEFVRLLVTPLAPGEAFEKAFGRSMAGALEDLRNYVQRPLPTVELSWSPGGPTAEARPLNSEDVQQARLDLDLQMGRWDTTEAELERLARRTESSARVETARALVALGKKEVSAAREHFERAIATGEAGARTYYEYAMLLRELGADSRLVTRNVEETVARDPRYAEAWFFLGVEAANRGDPQGAIRAIERAVEIRPRQASFWHALVLAYHQAGKREEARRAARRLELGARTPQEREMAQAALRLAGAEEPWVELGRRAPVETPSSWFMPRGDHRVEGTLRRIECLNKRARLLVATVDETVSLLVSDPEKVAVRNAGETTFEFGCGAGAQSVVVEYVAREDKDAGTVGDVTAIEVRE